jgi:hypothetical protein
VKPPALSPPPEAGLVSSRGVGERTTRQEGPTRQRLTSARESSRRGGWATREWAEEDRSWAEPGKKSAHVHFPFLFYFLL